MKIGLFVVLISIGIFASGCGGGDQAEAPPPATTAPPTTAPVTVPAGGTTVGTGQAETIVDQPFSLNIKQPVPADFETAYQRRSLIAVQFYKVSQDAFYPQGLEPDQMVNASIETLRTQYPTIEFFAYEITNPGSTVGDAELQQGEYGTLAAQLGVGMTPFFATLAPAAGEDGYIIKNLFQGYVPEPVLNQALFDLSAIQVEDNTSDIDVTMDQLELTESGGGIEYITVKNRSGNPVNLQGFTLRTLDPETGQIDPDSATVTISDPVEVQPNKRVSVGRAPDVIDADGNQVAGTFEGGDGLGLGPGDQVALLDAGGAVAVTITV